MLHLSDKNFKAVIIKMFPQEIMNTLETHEKIESPSKETKNIKKNQIKILELKIQSLKLINSLDELSSRVKITEEGKNSKHKDGSVEITQSEQCRENRFLKVQSLRTIWGNSQRSIICATEVPEGNEKEVGAKKKLEK